MVNLFISCPYGALGAAPSLQQQKRKRFIIMKNNLLVLLCTVMISHFAQAQMVITEIMYNPPESGVDSLEFIEVYNNSAATVNMTDWKLEFGTFSFTIPTLTVGAGQYQLFSVNAGAMQNNFGKSSVQWTSGALSNNGTSIRIKNSSGALIDSLTFDDVAPWPTSPDGLGYSLVLCDPNSDNTVAANWKECPTATSVFINNTQVFANPGAPAGCVSGLVANNDLFAVAPGQATTLDVLTNDNTPNPVTSLTITAAPQHGTAVVLADNTIRYTPSNGYCGPDALSYRVCDAPASCATATVSISVKCYPQRSIEEVNNVNLIGVADSVNVSCELTGIVYGVNLRQSAGGLQFVIMNTNGTEGISVFSGLNSFGYTVTEGDEVTIRGTIAQFSGLVQMNLDTVFMISSGNQLASPDVVLRAEESTENRLIKINNLRLVDPAQWTPGVGPGFNVRVYSMFNLADTIVMRIDNDVDLFNFQNPPSEPFNMTGLGGQFDSSVPYSSGYQVLPRYADDISTLSSTREVDFSKEVRISPNPVSDFVKIETQILFDQIRVFGLNGALWKTIEHPQEQEVIDLSRMMPGIYALHFVKGTHIWATAIIKQ